MMRIFLLWMATAVMWATAQETPLPKWQPDERKNLEVNGWLAGGHLLARELSPEEQQEPPVQELEMEQPKPEEMAQGPSLSPVPEKAVVPYFAEKPSSFLVDPQGLMPPQVYRERLDFLTYHSGDSSIDLYLYLFDGFQEIPDDVREEEMMERFFTTGKPAAVVFYYLGNPKRSVLHLSPALMEAVPAVEQRLALQSSVMQALEKVTPLEQLEAFLVQASIRVYWMERLLDSHKPEAGAATAMAEKPAKPVKLSFFDRHEPEIRALMEKVALPVSGLLAAVLAIGAAVWWVRRNVRYRFPEFEVEPRLGGAHGAGVGAVISFASASLPPASQRDQVPDYLRRA